MTTEEQYQEIAAMLKKIKTAYRAAITIDWKKKQRFILQYLKGYASLHQALKPLQKVCGQLLEEYPEGEFPHDNTLLDEARKRLKYPFTKAIPDSHFDEDMIVYKVSHVIIKEEIFNKLDEIPLGKSDQLIIDRLKHMILHTFVEGVNIKGENPYYKRHYNQFIKSQKLTLELLDEEFDNYIEYFQGDKASA